MLNKDFENFELRLKTLREESQEDFSRAEKIFNERYAARLEDIFPRDILWAKKLIATYFMIESVDAIQSWKDVDAHTIFSQSVSRIISSLYISPERKESLKNNILLSWDLSQPLKEFFIAEDDISRDPFFALVEDFSMDGVISHEEFILLQQAYESRWDFLSALESLPDTIRDMFHAHIELTLNQNLGNKKTEFEAEYSQELKNLESKGVNIEPVVIFVSRSFYKTPWKYKKFEHPKRRMRRTFKMALLKILRAKLWNIDAQILLDRFEAGENFEDFFMLLFKILEVVNEDPKGEEIYSILKLDEEITSNVFTAEENKQKILEWESLVMSIASIFSQGTHELSEEELENGLLGKLLEESTDIVGEDVYFNREDEKAWIYAESSKENNPDDETEEEIDYDAMSPITAYEMLEHQFHKIEEEKRKAFLAWNYDEIDIYNERLRIIESKLSKLSQLLGNEEM